MCQRGILQHNSSWPQGARSACCIFFLHVPLPVCCSHGLLFFIIRNSCSGGNFFIYLLNDCCYCTFQDMIGLRSFAAGGKLLQVFVLFSRSDDCLSKYGVSFITFSTLLRMHYVFHWRNIILLMHRKDSSNLMSLLLFVKALFVEWVNFDILNSSYFFVDLFFDFGFWWRFSVFIFLADK